MKKLVILSIAALLISVNAPTFAKVSLTKTTTTSKTVSLTKSTSNKVYLNKPLKTVSLTKTSKVSLNKPTTITHKTIIKKTIVVHQTQQPQTIVIHHVHQTPTPVIVTPIVSNPLTPVQTKQLIMICLLICFGC